MKGIIVTGLVGLIFFGGAYAYSTMQLVSQKAAEEEEGEKEGSDIGQPEAVASTESEPAKAVKTKAESKKIPVPFPPKALPEEALVELTNSIRKKEAELKQREELLNTREGQFRFVLADIAREKREYESVVKKAEAKVIEAQRILKLVETKSQEIENKMQQLKQEQSADTALRSVGEQASDKQLAEVLQSFDPTIIASLFKSKAESGQVDQIGRILSTFDGATMSKVIAAIPDDELRNKAIDAVRQAYGDNAKMNLQNQKR